MNWLEILKMPMGVKTPGSDFKSSEEYNRGTKEQKAAYHSRMRYAFRTNLQILQRRASGSLSDADPVVDEHPVNQEIDRLQEMVRFHGRQYDRLIGRGGINKEDFFSLEEEKNRTKVIPQTTRTGSRIVHKEIPQEEYDELNDKQKTLYHERLEYKYRNEGNKKLSSFHGAMRLRLQRKSNLPTFSSFSEDIYLRQVNNKQYTKEEYLQLSDEDKMRYHYRTRMQLKRAGNENLSKWHNRMANRLRFGSKLPTYYSPEHEQEETNNGPSN